MKHIKIYPFILLLFIVCCSTTAWSTAFYVALDGNDSNSGTSLQLPWKTLSHAASSSLVQPGDIVYVQAGEIGAEQYGGNVVFTRGGTSGHPVIYAGYRKTPGDNPLLNYQPGEPLQPRIMPLFNGGDRTSGIAFDIQAPYITIRNFQITRYAVAVQIWGAENHHIVLDNITAVSLGELGGAGGYSYSGKGITISHSSDNQIHNSVVVNANAEGISLLGDNNLIENIRIYSDEVDETIGADGTDYYIVISGKNNTVRRCAIERVVPEHSYTTPNYPHVGHGIGFKEAAENNLVEDCTAKNLEGGGFYVRWGNARNNVFRRCSAFGAIGFLCRNGAEHNLFDSCTANGCSVAVRFLRSEPEGDADTSNFAALNNHFVNCVFANSTKSVIDFNQYSGNRPDDAVVNTSFLHCTIYKARYLISSNRPNHGNSMINCIVSGVESLEDPASNVDLHFSFATSCFYDGFAAPAGRGNIFSDPRFVSAGSNNFHLTKRSPCIDSGQAANNEAAKDRDGISRPVGNGWDMGAYEYTNTASILFLTLPAIFN